jgi:hypothetical protein
VFAIRAVQHTCDFPFFHDVSPFSQIGQICRSSGITAPQRLSSIWHQLHVALKCPFKFNRSRSLLVYGIP